MSPVEGRPASPLLPDSGLCAASPTASHTDKIAGASEWTRRAWLTRNAVMLLVATHRRGLGRPTRHAIPASAAARFAAQSVRQNLEPWHALAQRAVDAAQQAGAQYADARLTRTIQHRYGFGVPAIPSDIETVGCGVRALVDGYWGFAACPTGELATPADAVVQLAQGAVAQARANATGGTARTVAMGQYPRVMGTWATPVVIDPFAVSLEEKGMYIAYWEAWAQEQGVYIDTISCYLAFTRQERVIATSDGSLVTQTTYESGGRIACKSAATGDLSLDLTGLKTIGKGWELFATDAQIPVQLTGMLARLKAAAADKGLSRPVPVNRYTLVCDGATMASIVGQTLGMATQVDRCLGYEANAGGTSFIDDPLSMVGHYQLAAPSITVTANRSAPTQLATVQWDDEGVAPESFTLIKDGVLVDFQTTREQAAWLAPYYAKVGKPVHSHGCAAVEDALRIPLQQRPNLALAPNPQMVRLDDLVADVKDGILIEEGMTMEVDFQARTGLFGGTMHKITNGRVGPLLQGGAVLFDTLDLFKHVVAVGGASTTAVVSHTPYDPSFEDLWAMLSGRWKGQPPQDTSYSVQAVAATITNQPIIDPSRKA